MLLEFPSPRVPRPNELAREVASQRALSFVRLLDRVEGYAHGDEVHPDRDGHRRIAATIAARISLSPSGP